MLVKVYLFAYLLQVVLGQMETNSTTDIAADENLERKKKDRDDPLLLKLENVIEYNKQLKGTKLSTFR